jgi:hypothetical protein
MFSSAFPIIIFPFITITPNKNINYNLNIKKIYIVYFKKSCVVASIDKIRFTVEFQTNQSIF